MEALAAVTDVELVLGHALTSPEDRRRVVAILDKASELFRKAARQTFTSDTSTSRLKVNAGAVVLPQRPVVAVSNVVDDWGSPVPFTGPSAGRLMVDLGSDRFVTVTYSHGGAVPELVRLTVAEIAMKVLSIDPKAASGAEQSSTSAGPFTESTTYATWAQGGQTMLAPEDVAIAKSFRVRTPRIWVMA